MKSLTLCLLAVVLSSLLGCGSNLPQTVPIAGRVTIDGQPPPAGGIVYFLPIEAAEGFPSRPGSGDFGPDGVLTVTTFRPGDGLMPGKYQISVECWETEPVMGGPPAKSFVPEKYQTASTSGLTLEIVPGARTETVDLNIVTE